MNEKDISYAISCHYSKWDKEPKNILDKYLLACDEITGFIVACSKVRPNGITDLTIKSVKKSLRKKSFAASVDREEINYGIKLINRNIEEHIENIIVVLRKNAKFLELKT